MYSSEISTVLMFLYFFVFWYFNAHSSHFNFLRIFALGNLSCRYYFHWILFALLIKFEF